MIGTCLECYLWMVEKPDIAIVHGRRVMPRCQQSRTLVEPNAQVLDRARDGSGLCIRRPASPQSAKER